MPMDRRLRSIGVAPRHERGCRSAWRATRGGGYEGLFFREREGAGGLMHPSRLTRMVLKLIASVCLTFAAPATSLAQGPLAETGAQSLFVDPSVRSSAMGHSSNAVFWGGVTNDWSNPALLAFRQGIQYEWG